MVNITSKSMKLIICAPLSLMDHPSWQRAEILRRIGFNVLEFDYTSYMHFGIVTRLQKTIYGVKWNFPKMTVNAFNNEFLNRVAAIRPDIVWVEKALLLLPETLVEAKQLVPGATFVSWQDDNPFGNRRFEIPIWKNFIQCLPFFDLHMVKQKRNIENFKTHGAKEVIQIHLGFWLYHRPYSPSEIPEYFKHEVVFMGTAIDQRPASIGYLLGKQGLPIDVYGWRWNRCWVYYRYYQHFHRAVFGPAYAQIISGSRICLCYVSKSNLDDYTNRSADIPACGGFLLAERTAAHQEMYREGIEADFFGSDEECADKIRFYLQNDEKRQKIARAGYERCIRSDYSLNRYVREAVQEIMRLRGDSMTAV